jgi:hypothetical protein
VHPALVQLVSATAQLAENQLRVQMAELLTVLALHPAGLSAERLAWLLYGDGGNQTTVRGEIHRLRGLIGSSLLRTRPYRLAATVDSDFGAVREAVRSGQVWAAMRGCAGEMLPQSEAPEILQLREELSAGLRGAVLESRDADLMYLFATNPLGNDDLEVHERLAQLLATGDPRLGAVLSRRERLRSECL